MLDIAYWNVFCEVSCSFLLMNLCFLVTVLFIELLIEEVLAEPLVLKLQFFSILPGIAPLFFLVPFFVGDIFSTFSERAVIGLCYELVRFEISLK